jgi:rubrerythrin
MIETAKSSPESTASDTERYLASSARLQVDDIDWSLAARAGLTEKEVFILTYFSDIEGQTIMYLRDLLSTRAAEEPPVIAFLTMWNYEEFFHGEALARLLKECGHSLEDARIAKVRRSAGLSEALESFGATMLSRIYAAEFPAVHAAWGATQEITTLRGYEEVQRQTTNPVLKLLCDRIAKQERRHFAWYFNNAKERLSQSPRAQRLTRRLMSRFWSPVGAGVKSKQEVKQLISLLFGAEGGWRLAEEIDAKIGSLPGLEGIQLMRPYIRGCFTDFVPPVKTAHA